MSYTVAFKLQVVEFADSFGNKFWMGTWILWKASARLEKEKQLMALPRQYDALILYSPVGSFLPHHVLLPLCSCHQTLHTEYMEASIRVRRILHDYFFVAQFWGCNLYSRPTYTLANNMVYMQEFPIHILFQWKRMHSKVAIARKQASIKWMGRSIAATLLTQHKPFTHDVDLPLAGLHY